MSEPTRPPFVGGAFVGQATAAFRFVDLHAGLGAFQAALSAYGGECVYALEREGAAADLYRRNWGRTPSVEGTDSTNGGALAVPEHDVLAVDLRGLTFPGEGVSGVVGPSREAPLDEVVQIVEGRRPQVVLVSIRHPILQVRRMREGLVKVPREEGYRVSETVCSPDQLPPARGGRPWFDIQHFVTATRVPESMIDRAGPPSEVARRGGYVDQVGGWGRSKWGLDAFLEDSDRVTGCDLSDAERRSIDAWDEFTEIMWEALEGRSLPEFPLWADSWRDVEEAWQADKAQVPDLPRLPRLDRDLGSGLRALLLRNYEFFIAYHRLIRDWAERWGVYSEGFPRVHRTLEWRAGHTRRLWDTVMHLGSSRIRAQPPMKALSGATLGSRIVIGPRGRRMSVREALRLHGLPDWYDLGGQNLDSMTRRMGSGVNVGVVWHVLREHVRRDEKLLRGTPRGRRIVEAVLGAPLSPDRILSELPQRRAAARAQSETVSGQSAPRERMRRMDRPFFIPAETPAEAVARIFSLTGAAQSRTRGEKRALIALRDALGLDIDVERTNAYTGRRIAEALDVEWEPRTHERRHTLTLEGLNALLEGTAEAYHRGSLRRLESQRPSLLSGPRWAAFSPAQSKIEAVNRISALTGSGPEWLGPGSKEHKRVLINLAEALAPQLDTAQSKTALAEALAREFGAPWSDDCKSTGYTISLAGLNTILAGAELRLGRVGVDSALLLGTPEQEGKALAAALLDGWRRGRDEPRVLWDARRSIEWMRDQGMVGAINQTEWQGWYFEAKGRAILGAAFTPNPAPPTVQYGNTRFDYSLRYVWDLKAHTERQHWPHSGRLVSGGSAAPLNDQEAMDACIQDQGLGFLMLGGVAVMDEDGEFLAWHRAFKGSQGLRPARSNSDRSRVRKAAFAPLHIEAFWFPNTAALEAAKAGGQITGFNQGAQAPRATGVRGADRRRKYNLHVPQARASTLRVARFDWPSVD